MKIDGQCHCGFISYEAEADPQNVVICHCTDCQNLSVLCVSHRGSRGRYLPASFRGADGLCEDGRKREQACPGFLPALRIADLRTSVGSGPKAYGVRLGTARQRDEFIPKIQIWSRSRQKWTENVGSIPMTERQ